MKRKKESEFEIEFDKQFTYAGQGNFWNQKRVANDMQTTCSPEDIKSFIRNLLSAQRQELIKEIEAMKKIKRNEDGAGVVIVGVYNQAIDDVLEKLKEKV